MFQAVGYKIHLVIMAIMVALTAGLGLLQETLVKIAKKLKKNNVAVDVVSLAAEEENAPKLEAFQVSMKAKLRYLWSVTKKRRGVCEYLLSVSQ